MISIFDANGTCLVRRDGDTSVNDKTVWIDLLTPTEVEEKSIEAALSLEVPTRAEMREIEASNRFYSEDGAQFMTAFVIHSNEKEGVTTSNITFILAGKRLITVRYGEPKAFTLFSDRACRTSEGCTNGAQVMIGLIETLIQRQADLIERLQDEVETLAPQIFGQKTTQQTQGRRLEVMLRAVGKQGDITSRAQESATSLHRTLLYFADAARDRGEDAKLSARIDSADRDILSLADLDRTEPDYQTVLGHGRDADAADAGCVRLRHELQTHAGTRLALRLSDRALSHVRVRAHSLHLLPPQGLAVN
jgi:magnesium transporter